MSVKPEIQPEKSLAAVCGLFCPACTLYIGTQEDPARLEALAKRFELPVEKVQCDGCRAERRGFYCRQCEMVLCAEKKGVEFCGECGDYPCDVIKTFKEAMPHRIELWENLARINEVGFETWFDEKTEHYACPECGTINSAYDRSCRRCGRTPSCEYVNRHGEAVRVFLKNRD